MIGRRWLRRRSSADSTAATTCDDVTTRARLDTVTSRIELADHLEQTVAQVAEQLAAASTELRATS